MTGLSIRARAEALHRPPHDNSAFERCQEEVRAAFSPTASRRKLIQAADFYAKHSGSGSDEAVNKCLADYTRAKKSGASCYALRSLRLFVMIEVRKLRATRSAEAVRRSVAA